MENLWIYILLIFIFIVRAIAKSAQKQIDSNKKAANAGGATDNEEIEDRDTVTPADRHLAWEDIFPSGSYKETAPKTPFEETPEKPKIKKIKTVQPEKAVAAENRIPAFEPVLEKDITEDAYDKESPGLFVNNTDDLRKAVIMSEILAKKF